MNKIKKEIFEQEKKLIVNKYSVDLKIDNGYITVINGYITVMNSHQDSIVLKTFGSENFQKKQQQTYAVLKDMIKRAIKRGDALCVYDFKFPALTEITYNYFLKYAGSYKIKPKFYVINFDDPQRSHRCNPLQPDSMTDFADAVEASQTVMNALNKTWIKKQGDIKFFAICIWALKLLTEEINDGNNYCSFPHAIEFALLDYDISFPILQSIEDPSIQNVLAPFVSAYKNKVMNKLLAPFVSAYKNKVMNKLEDKFAPVRLELARLTSPVLYWVMTGQDFSLDINNPESPKILCLGNNPDRQKKYGGVLSLYSTRLISVINKKKKHPSTLVWDETSGELPTLLPQGDLDFGCRIADNFDPGNEPIPILTEFPLDNDGNSMQTEIVNKQFLKVKSDVQKLSLLRERVGH